MLLKYFIFFFFFIITFKRLSKTLFSPFLPSLLWHGMGLRGEQQGGAFLIIFNIAYNFWVIEQEKTLFVSWVMDTQKENAWWNLRHQKFEGADFLYLKSFKINKFTVMFENCFRDYYFQVESNLVNDTQEKRPFNNLIIRANLIQSFNRLLNLQLEKFISLFQYPWYYKINVGDYDVCMKCRFFIELKKKI